MFTFVNGSAAGELEVEEQEVSVSNAIGSTTLPSMPEFSFSSVLFLLLFVNLPGMSPKCRLHLYPALGEEEVLELRGDFFGRAVGISVHIGRERFAAHRHARAHHGGNRQVAGNRAGSHGFGRAGFVDRSRH